MFDPALDKLNKFFWEDSNAINRMNESHLVSYKCLFIIRAILCVYTTGIMIFQTIETHEMAEFIKYLTYIGAVCVQWYFLFTMIEMISYKQHNNHTYYVRVWKFTHFMFEFAFCVQLMIFTVFWAYIVPSLKEDDFDEIKGLNVVLTTQLHGGFFVCIVIDFILNSVEFVKSHLLVIYLICIIYGIFNMAYTLIWEPIYPGVTWDNWQTYLIFAVGLVLFYLMHKLGQIVFRKWKIKNILKQQAALNEQESDV